MVDAQSMKQICFIGSMQISTFVLQSIESEIPYL